MIAWSRRPECLSRNPSQWLVVIGARSVGSQSAGWRKLTLDRHHLVVRIGSHDNGSGDKFLTYGVALPDLWTCQRVDSLGLTGI